MCTVFYLSPKEGEIKVFNCQSTTEAGCECGLKLGSTLRSPFTQLKYPSSVCLIEAGIQQYLLFLFTTSFSHPPCETLSTASQSENPISSSATTTTTTSTITMGEQRALLSPFSTFAQTSSAVLCWSHWIDFEQFFSASGN